MIYKVPILKKRARNVFFISFQAIVALSLAFQFLCLDTRYRDDLNGMARIVIRYALKLFANGRAVNVKPPPADCTLTDSVTRVRTFSINCK